MSKKSRYLACGFRFSGLTGFCSVSAILRMLTMPEFLSISTSLRCSRSSCTYSSLCQLFCQRLPQRGVCHITVNHQWSSVNLEWRGHYALIPDKNLLSFNRHPCISLSYDVTVMGVSIMGFNRPQNRYMAIIGAFSSFMPKFKICF